MEPDGELFQVIDTAPGSHIYTGGLLGNLQDPTGPMSPDYVCGELTWDGAIHNLIWYHWNDHNWVRTMISHDISIAVGMDMADLTGNGKADIVAAEWPLGSMAGNPGHVYWFEQPGNAFTQEWIPHVLATGWGKAHDLVLGDISGTGSPDVLVRLKDERMSWFSRPEDPRSLWTETAITEVLSGDGTALYDVTGTGSLDIVTGAGYFENQDGAGKRWQYHPFQAAIDLSLDAETRVAVGDCLQDGSVTVVIAESEVLTNARLVALHSSDGGQHWATHVLIDRASDLGALHSLQLEDINGNGWLDIFVAEMELYVEDKGITRRPTWNVLLNKTGLTFEKHVVLDQNMGAHQGAAGRISRPDGTDFIAKNWKANTTNAWEACNHVVHVGAWTAPPG